MAQGVAASRWQNFQNFIGTLDGAIEQQRALSEQAKVKLLHGRTDWQNQKRRLSSFDTLADRVRQQELVTLNRREQRDSDEHTSRQFRLRSTASTD
jgi:flagellar FliJ protein